MQEGDALSEVDQECFQSYSGESVLEGGALCDAKHVTLLSQCGVAPGEVAVRPSTLSACLFHNV